VVGALPFWERLCLFCFAPWMTRGMGSRKQRKSLAGAAATEPPTTASETPSTDKKKKRKGAEAASEAVAAEPEVTPAPTVCSAFG
jgi:hypothetical protein